MALHLNLVEPVSFSPRVEKQLRYLAMIGLPNEVCGVIYPHGIVVQHYNSHPHPQENFDAEIDLEDVKAIWHSHPRGTQSPSGTDLRFMEECARLGLGIRHIIVTTGRVLEYEAVYYDSPTAAA